jgi:CheY-like chemotaxis protein
MKVLLADDYVDTVETFAAFLRLHGHEVHTVKTGEDAVTLAAAVRFQAAKQEFSPAFKRLRSQATNLVQPAQFDISVGYPALHVLSEAARLRIGHIVVGA